MRFDAAGAHASEFVLRAASAVEGNSTQRWLHRIPADVLRSHAALAVNAALHTYIAEASTLQADAERAVCATADLPRSEAHDELRTEALILSALSSLVSKGSLAEAAEIMPMLEPTSCRPDGLAAGYLHLAIVSGRCDEATGAMLERLQARLQAADFRSMALHVRILQAIDAQTRGDASEALRIVHAALPDIERTGFHRLVLDFPLLRPLLQECRTPFAQQMLGGLAGSDSPHRAFQLTPQELLITKMLCRGLGPLEIADALTLGTTTILSHMRRIFRKMNVHSRAEAIRAARDAGLAP